MTKLIRHRPVVSLLAVTVVIGGVATLRSAGQAERVTFAEAQIFVELNDTDGDLGFHALIDGGPWTSLTIEDPRERKLLAIASGGRLRNQGLTELFFESAEPSFDELAPEDFFKRFPEGRYEIEGVAQNGRMFEAKALLSHVLAAPPQILVSGTPAAEDCDVSVPLVPRPVVIDWEPVTTSHPEIGRSGPVQISLYQLVVEREDVKLSLDLPSGITELTVPARLLALGKEFKIEVIARTVTGNNTAVESCFRVE
jgi:hypothetical protein